MNWRWSLHVLVLYTPRVSRHSVHILTSLQEGAKYWYTFRCGCLILFTVSLLWNLITLSRNFKFYFAYRPIYQTSCLFKWTQNKIGNIMELYWFCTPFSYLLTVPPGFLIIQSTAVEAVGVEWNGNSLWCIRIEVSSVNTPCTSQAYCLIRHVLK
jgi:hypothetical protein